MTSTIALAEQLAEQISAQLDAAGLARYRATIDAKRLQLPGVLVVPLPRREYEGDATTYCSYRVIWSVFCLASPPADLMAMRHLDAMAGVVEQTEGVVTALPASYVIAGLSSDPLPAYQFEIDGGI